MFKNRNLAENEQESQNDHTAAQTAQESERTETESTAQIEQSDKTTDTSDDRPPLDAYGARAPATAETNSVAINTNA